MMSKDRISFRNERTKELAVYCKRVDGAVYPELGQVEEVVGLVHGSATWFAAVPVLSSPVLALRAGGKHTFGRTPYHEAAYVGGGNTVRGFARQRYGGESSVYGNAELRIPIARLRILVPGNLGIFGLADTGRVYLDGESSETWHTGVGGGLWFAVLNAENTVSLSVATSDEGTAIYMVSGLAF